MAGSRKPSSRPPEVAAALDGMDIETLRAFTGDVVDAAARRAPRSLPPQQREPRRRPPAEEPFAMTVRLDLVGVRPPVWRRVELPSTLPLDEVHDLLQLLFGWSDSHLHRFALGQSVWDREAEVFLCPWDAEEGDGDGTPTRDVRLDTVLAEPGDRLHYVYDYGAEWRVRLVVEEVGAPIRGSRCTAGRGTPPPEDGGDLDMGDEEWGARGAAAVRLDVAALDAAVASWDRQRRHQRHLPGDVVDLLQRVDGTPAHPLLQGLVEDADLAGPCSLRPDEAGAMVHRYRWLLERVGDGVRLTSGGWLPPQVVAAATAELGLDREWIGKGNRENLTEPVRRLRQSAQRLGLLAVRHGLLRRTKQGAALTEDPSALWSHVAERAAVAPRDPFARSAMVLWLLGAAAGRPRATLGTDLAAILSAGGWASSDGAAVDGYAPGHAAADVRDVLDAVRATGDDGVPTSDGRVFARAVLRRLAEVSRGPSA